MNEVYKKLVLDPKCLKPAYLTQDSQIYIDSINAINKAQKSKYITDSEYAILKTFKNEIRKNRFMDTPPIL